MVELCGAQGFSRSVLKALEHKGLVQRSLPAISAPTPSAAQGRQLTAAQGAAVEAIQSAPAAQSFLLWGITGAGKTEVYLQAATQALAAQQSSLLLTPEIGLIPQLLDRCRERFGAAVVEFHSGMGEAERVAAWRRCLEGTPLIAVGTRSAIFLPLANLGLIVVDEEHDSSYKQDSPMPCYHARDVARLRAQRSGARLVLGSATPSLETWLACQPPAPSMQLLQLPERIGARPMPAVRVIDMRHELAEGHRRLISRALMGRLEQLQSKAVKP
jgi:primosomal protein N' (replication factor Y)